MDTIEITGKTYPHRLAFRAMGGKWNGAKKAWILPAEKAGEALALMTKVVDPGPAADPGIMTDRGPANRERDRLYAWAVAYRAESEARQHASLSKARASGVLRRCRSCNRERWADNRCLFCFDPPEIVADGEPTPMTADEFRAYCKEEDR